MCLGIPGEVVRISDGEPGEPPMGRVDFGGVVKEVCLVCVPEVGVGDYVIVHAGFAIARVDEAEAARVFDHLREIEALGVGEPDS
jgi:hydrogenase expression/formation protein HypC